MKIHRKKFKITIDESNSFFKANKTMFRQLVELVNIGGKWKDKVSNLPNLLQWINECVPLLVSNVYTIETKVHWIINDLHDFPHCHGCGKSYEDRNVQTVKKGYHQFCSSKCALNSPEVKQKTIATCIERYGVSSPGQNSEVKEKAKKTNLRKYGVEFSFQAESVKAKSRQTSLQKYGTTIPSKASEVIEKTKKTKLTKYGDNQPWHSDEAHETRKTNWLLKYGVDHPMKLESSKLKIQKTMFDKYGVKHITQSDQFARNRVKKIFERKLLNNELDTPLFSFDEFFKADHTAKFSFQCKKCGKVFKSRHINGHHSSCPSCYPVVRQKVSNEERELQTFLKSLKIECTFNDRSTIDPLELDIIIPSKHIAIEFDGLYWHNDELKDHNYHLLKTTQCEKQGLQLIHIFESEWIYKRRIVESRLKNLFGIYDKTVFARKCKIKEIQPKTAYEFQEDNHIQGAVNSKVNLGLYDGEELISLMTFGKCRFDKKHEWELVRFCNKLGYHVPGAAGKLLKFFERNYSPKSLVSYADRRWSQGKLYTALGFSLEHISPPNYQYFATGSFLLESRLKYQKHKQSKLLEKFDSTKSEVQNMRDNGYRRIFDCGNFVFSKTYNF